MFLLHIGVITGVLVNQRPHEYGDLATALGLSQLEPLAVGRGIRLATNAQRRAIRIRDNGCLMPGCGAPPAQTEAHHLQPYAAGGPTDLNNLVSLCFVHHRAVDLRRLEISRNPDPTGPGYLFRRTRRNEWISRT